MPSNNSWGRGVFERGACAFDFGEDLGSVGSPDVGPWVGVSLDEIGVDVADQRGDRAEATGADDIAGQVGEEALDQIEPG
jgi:hypothetical protein